MVSRRRFLELGFFALAGLALSGAAAGCGGRRSVLRPEAESERTDAEEEKDRRRRRG